jgi:AbrB family looped-hinge helix DNA binding protein
MRITSKGQVTIPIPIRRQAGLTPNTEVEFGFDGTTVTLHKARTSRPGRESRGERAVRLLQEGPRLSMTPDELLELTRGE